MHIAWGYGVTVSLTECTLAWNEANVGATRRRSPQPASPPRPHALMVRLRLEVLRLHAVRSKTEAPCTSMGVRIRTAR